MRFMCKAPCFPGELCQCPVVTYTYTPIFILSHMALNPQQALVPVQFHQNKVLRGLSPPPSGRFLDTYYLLWSRQTSGSRGGLWRWPFPEARRHARRRD